MQIKYMQLVGQAQNNDIKLTYIGVYILGLIFHLVACLKITCVRCQESLDHMKYYWVAGFAKGNIHTEGIMVHKTQRLRGI